MPLSHEVDHTVLWSFRRRYLLALLSCLTLGCGAEKYQERLAQTSEYFEYKDRINRELGPEWTGHGISIKVPKQFQLIPPPATPDGEEEEFASPTEDHRQPHYLGIELPGLVGAWKANVQADAEGSDHGRTAYLYLFSNYDLYHQPPDQFGVSVDPTTFMSDFERQLTAAIGVFLPEGDGGTGADKNIRYREMIPAGPPNSKFRPRSDFTAVALSPGIPVSDVPLEMQLYEWLGSKVQVAVLMVYPASVSPQEHLQERLQLAMETFVASDQPPRPAGSSSGPSPSGQKGPSRSF
ncbi:MAG: hypothetical protein KDA86_12705 [Planctomycetaceae bacterium]|nr:hypothetical protein [Planctomycetaceae bacterium]